MEQDSKFKSDRPNFGRNTKLVDPELGMHNYQAFPNCADDIIIGANMGEINPSMPISPKKAECNIKFFSHRESR